MSTKNRLGELQEFMVEDEKPGKKKNKSNKKIAEEVEENVLDKLEVIRKSIDKLQENREKCEDVYRRNTKAKDLHKNLKGILKNSETISYNIATNLKTINQTLKHTEDKSSATFRMQLIQYTGLVERFKTTVTEQETWAQQVLDVQKNFIQKCYQITNHEPLDDEQLNQLIEQNPTIFTQDYIENELEARKQLADVELRHKELIVIEEHLVEIRDLFAQLATLVELQQESINRVEFFTAQATDYIDNTTATLQKAKKSKKRGRKIKIGILIVLIVIIVIIIASLFG